MDDTVYRQAAIDALKTEFKRIPTTAIRAKAVIEQLPSAQPERKKESAESELDIAQERYYDLREYFKDCSDQGKGILHNRKEFKAWLERMRWHVVECDKLARQLESQPEQRWIPVSERLPEKPNVYTVTDSKDNVVRFVFYDTVRSREYWLRCVKAWMPLPEPYKGGVE